MKLRKFLNRRLRISGLIFPYVVEITTPEIITYLRITTDKEKNCAAIEEFLKDNPALADADILYFFVKGKNLVIELYGVSA